MSSASTLSVRSLSSSEDDNSLMLVNTSDLLVRDFGWPALSPRYHGDHTPESNPDWAHDPLESKEAQKDAFERMEKSYSLYMSNLTSTKPVAKKRMTWSKFLPWVR